MNAEDTDEPERNIVNNFNALNSPAFYMQPIEGHLILFPSSLSHHTRFLGGEFQGERLGIVGDMSLMLKEDQLHYSTGYIDNKYWKKY